MSKLATVVWCLSAASLPVVTACAPQAAPAAPAPPSAAAPTTPGKPAWQEEREKTLAAAKSEGIVMLTTSTSVIRTALVEGFKNAYGIPLEVIAAPGGTGITAILAERRAG